MRKLLIVALLGASPLLAQTLSTPPSFRLVTPHGPGSITINTAGGWVPENFVLYDKGTRAVFLLHNETLSLTASYILQNDETFDYNKESCINDSLGPLFEGPLKKATVKNKVSTTRKLPNGQTLDVGSYLIAKQDGFALNQQNVFGFTSHNHTCAEVHMSRTMFKTGDEHVFDPVLDAFTVDLTYSPTTEDYALMANLLPPGMASEYTGAKAAASTTTMPAAVGDQPHSLTFGLADHPGYLHMDAPNFDITELSAKRNGMEFGIRAKDKTLSGAEVLGFLFVSNPVQPNAVACRDWMLASEKKEGVKDRKITATSATNSDSGVPVALVDYEQTKAPAADRFVRRFFVAQGDLCADISITGSAHIMDEAASKPLITSLTFDPSRKPDFTAKLRYASVLFDHQAVAAAAPVYESALALVDSTEDPTKWRRVVTDQASMSYGMAGNLTKSRELNEAAITKDPDYPLYYYNLACADAEAGDAPDAQKHLAQAYARRANILKGETMPDARKDDSFQKLKGNKQFWDFVQTLPAS